MGIRKRLKSSGIQRNDLVRPHAMVQQLANSDESPDLFLGVETLAFLVTFREREAVTPFPDSQRVLRDARVALDLADGVACGFDFCSGHVGIKSASRRKNNDPCLGQVTYTLSVFQPPGDSTFTSGVDMAMSATMITVHE